MKYSGEVENAIEVQNGVAQGLSSAIMTNEMKEAEKFLNGTSQDTTGIWRKETMFYSLKPFIKEENLH